MPTSPLRPLCKAYPSSRTILTVSPREPTQDSARKQREAGTWQRRGAPASERGLDGRPLDRFGQVRGLRQRVGDLNVLACAVPFPSVVPFASPFRGG